MENMAKMGRRNGFLQKRPVKNMESLSGLSTIGWAAGWWEARARTEPGA
jgi:hypothetical protein